MTGTGIPPEIEDWFAGRGWRVRDHQRAMLEASDRGDHALLVADTGAGKTLAGFLPTLAAFTPSRLGDAPPPDGLHTIYVSPLKALAEVAAAKERARRGQAKYTRYVHACYAPVCVCACATA